MKKKNIATLWFLLKMFLSPIKPDLILCRHNVRAIQSKIQWSMIWWMLFWSHSLGGIYSNTAYKLRIQTKNLNCDGQVCTCFTFCHQSTRWQTRDNTTRDVTGQKLTAPLLFLGLDMSPPHWYQWMRGGNTEKHIWMQKELNKHKTKDAQHAQNSGSSSKHTERRCYKLCWRFYCLFLPSSSSSSSTSDHRKI